MNLQERLEYCRAAAKNQRPKKLPIYGNMWLWAVLDSGYQLKDALYDWDIMFDAWMQFQERYDLDYYCNPGARNPFRFTETLGGNKYVLDAEKNTVQFTDYHLLEENEYDELCQNVVKFKWEKAIPRKCSTAMEADAETMKKAFAELGQFFGFKGRLSEAMMSQYGAPERSQCELLIPFEDLFLFYRGIKNISIDLRRRYGKVKEAVEAIFQQEAKGMNDAFFASNAPNDIYVFDTSVCFLGHSILNTKQFEDLYWSYLAPYFKQIEERDMVCMVFSEAEILRFADFFKDYKNGCFAIQPEMDNLVDVHKALPNCSLMGGLGSDLGHGTPEDNVNGLKKLIDAVGDSGLTICPQKMITYQNDCKRENLLAVKEFVDNYQF